MILPENLEVSNKLTPLSYIEELTKLEARIETLEQEIRVHAGTIQSRKLFSANSGKKVEGLYALLQEKKVLGVREICTAFGFTTPNSARTIMAKLAQENEEE